MEVGGDQQGGGGRVWGSETKEGSLLCGWGRVKGGIVEGGRPRYQGGRELAE